ncbi:hypothetical protein BGW80DRAFT_1253717 [Lactifluus volemus]|nr:hypothetical protein BGW80DRAFT_1253717 [Lactifluus volemus]
MTYFITRRSSSIGVHEKAGSPDADIGRWETVGRKVLGNGKGASVFATRDSAHAPGRIHGLTPKIIIFNRWGHIALNVISISCSGLAFSDRQEGQRYRTGSGAASRSQAHRTSGDVVRKPVIWQRQRGGHLGSSRRRGDEGKRMWARQHGGREGREDSEPDPVQALDR